jgi:cysteine-rich repeat protein
LSDGGGPYNLLTNASRESTVGAQEGRMRASPIIIFFALLIGCGDNLKPMIPDDVPVICGNGLLEVGEECDDDDNLKDSNCDATCHFTCGNGVVDSDVGELCDTEIASGAGACPSSCDDGLACTDDVLSSSGCAAVCLHSSITAPANGDGCCPTGADATTDTDCAGVCGNGVVEPGEVCDKTIPAGMAGACPTACDDGQVCTTNTLSNAGTCQAACSFTPITNPMNGDGCCPSGANSTNDTDCVVACGNGIYEPPSETCDKAIPAGMAGACPTMCDDGVACTSNVLGNPGTCQAVCVYQPITSPANGDGCCPTGANANNDNDCMPMCGNGVTEMGEQCDDGNTNNTDACANNCTANVLPTAFRFSDLDLRDPHVFVQVLTCTDVTNSNFTGFSVNGELQTQITSDGNADGLLDFSPTLVFKPFSQAAATMPLELHFASCTAPIGSTTCTASTSTVVTGTATNMTSGTCLSPLPNTTRAAYTPAITSPTAPCFVSNAITVTISLGGIPITLHDAQVAATYVGNPATSMANGLLRGFISEADADATIIPASFPIVGGKPLSSLLAGGAGSCKTATYSDKDTNNGVSGWWFYLNFPATRVPWM